MFQLNTFLFWLFSNSKEKIILFTKHMRIQSRSYNKNKRSFSINPFAPHSSRIRKILFKFEFVHLESGFFYIYLVYLFSFFFFFLLNIFPSLFLYHSLSPIGLILSNLTHFLIERRVRNKSDFFFDQKYKNTMWNLRFFPLPISHRYSIWINREPFLLYESILFHSNSFPIPPKENLELDPKLTG